MNNAESQPWLAYTAGATISVQLTERESHANPVYLLELRYNVVRSPEHTRANSGPARPFNQLALDRFRTLAARLLSFHRNKALGWVFQHKYDYGVKQHGPKVLEDVLLENAIRVTFGDMLQPDATHAQLGPGERRLILGKDPVVVRKDYLDRPECQIVFKRGQAWGTDVVWMNEQQVGRWEDWEDVTIVGDDVTYGTDSEDDEEFERAQDIQFRFVIATP